MFALFTCSLFNDEENLSPPINDDEFKILENMNKADQTPLNNMDMHDHNLDSPDWLKNWRIQQEAERERLQNLDTKNPGGQLPAPPIRPPKRPELRVRGTADNQVLIFTF